MKIVVSSALILSASLTSAWQLEWHHSVISEYQQYANTLSQAHHFMLSLHGVDLQPATLKPIVKPCQTTDCAKRNAVLRQKLCVA